MLDSEGLKDRERGLASALCLCHLISSRRAFASRMIPFKSLQLVQRKQHGNLLAGAARQRRCRTTAALPKNVIPGLLVCGSGLQS